MIGDKIAGDRTTQKKEMEFEISPSGEGFYSDSTVISHNPSKFFIDFRQVTPRVDGIGEKRNIIFVLARKTIIIEPVHAKLMLQSLTDNLSKYEKQYGKIKLPKGFKFKAKEKSASTDVNYIG